MDLIIRNGKVVSSTEVRIADLHIKDGKISDIIPAGNNESDYNVQIIDAAGKLVMPGGVDVHTHLDMPFMGTYSTDNFLTGTIAAAFGGTTSIIDYAMSERNQSLMEALAIWHDKARGKAVIDYSFHMAIVPPVENIISELPGLVKAGITSIKCYLAYKNSLMIDDSSLFKLLKEAKKLSILVCIHAENGDIIDNLTFQNLADGNVQPIYHALSRPAILEGESVGRVLKFANLAEVPVYLVHLSTKDALKEVKRARKKYQLVYIETCPQYMLLSQNRYLEDNFNGAKYVMSPPLRDKLHQKSLLKALRKEYIDVVATDHCPFNFNVEKQMGRNDFTRIPNGIPGIETRLPLMFQKMVIEENLPLNQFVRQNCTQPAKIFGMKNKGDIQIGMDADIAIWDPEYSWTIRTENLHQNVDYTPFENFRITGKPVTVLSRGNIIIENNEFKAKPGCGEFISRNSNIQAKEPA